MFIAYDTATGQTLVLSIPHGVNPEQAAPAAAKRFGPGSWREITPEEAAELQRPTSAELIKAQIAVLEARQTDRMVRGAALGIAEDKAMLQAIEDEISALRNELHELTK